MSDILSRCSFTKQHPYRSPWWLWNGDLTTLFFGIFCRGRAVQFTRIFVPVSSSSSLDSASSATFGSSPPSSEFFCLDWTFPSQKISLSSTPVLLLLPGVGGDSHVPYIRQTCSEALAKGWVCCVLLARGLGSSRVRDVRQIFNPAECFDDIHGTLELIGRVFGGPVYLAGFSLGGVTLCNFLARYGPLPNKSLVCSAAGSTESSVLRPPHRARLAGAVSISGAFRVGFMTWWRYQSVYQRVIVPALLLELWNKYGQQLEQFLPGRAIRDLLSSTCYQELHRNFFVPLRGSSESESPQISDEAFCKWRSAMEGFDFRHNIQVPLLFLAAQDDPFHHVDMIGVERAPTNENIAYYITETGGHVAWPRDLRDFSFFSSLIVDFCSNCK